MTRTTSVNPPEATDKSVSKNKNQQVIDLLSRDSGATLEDMSTYVGWLPHSTRTFLTGLKKKGLVIESSNVDGVRRYRIASNGGA
nr:DUF3489 domain-containing protein [uncultured Sphingorhabdus sp.]